ncbi:MAG: UDP-N-acetylglucosamine--N-acetylmuramyl-(pentapeptide) pyrophosphoryl-undecaprenol N-acetylglucosamine transferase, partial [Clostridia bacterium]|nr:UDP-N-acetylglucosamine--N-acetylmuramyl-(pentapeptide) pyrophosphoryl-undecaprenol N-acetylglucosamine transferase [Clostridia bacterium]
IIKGYKKYIIAMKKILFCGGGSAGHVIPNIALIEQLSEYDNCYLGTNAIEENICKINKVKFYKFEAVKLVRGKILCNLAIPFKLIKSIKQAGQLLDEIKPDLLFCKGGYVCIPPAIAAKKRKIPILAHESDIEAGLANKLIASRCKKMLTAFPITASKFKNGKFVGTPMRKNLFGRDKQEAKAFFNLDSRPTIIVFGGGSGSKIINENIRKIAFDLCKKINILHLCGKGNKVETNIYGYKQIEFAEDMGLVYACADGAVARCGSNSANELIALKIPTLFIPLENSSSRGDQVKNAQFFKNAGLCRTLKEKELNPDILKNEINSLLQDTKLKTALDNSKIECGNNSIIKEIKLALQ